MNHVRDFRTQHIAPIEIRSGSVSLYAEDVIQPPTNAQSRKQVIVRNKKIEGVRVIMTDGMIKADYKDDRAVKGGHINIWVKDPPTDDNPDIKLNTTGEGLQAEYSNSGSKFDHDNRYPTSHKRYGHKYAGQNERIMRVIILNDQREPIAEVKTDIYNEQEIDRILIWT